MALTKWHYELQNVTSLLVTNLTKSWGQTCHFKSSYSFLEFVWLPFSPDNAVSPVLWRKISPAHSENKDHQKSWWELSGSHSPWKELGKWVSVVLNKSEVNWQKVLREQPGPGRCMAQKLQEWYWRRKECFEESHVGGGVTLRECEHF